jgi:chromosome segregation ATPase
MCFGVFCYGAAILTFGQVERHAGYTTQGPGQTCHLESCDAIRTRLQTWEEGNNWNRDQLKKCQKEGSVNVTSTQELQAKHDALSRSQEQLNITLGKVEGDLNASIAEKGRVETQLRAANDMTTDLQAQLSAVNSNKSELEAELSAANLTRLDLEKELSAESSKNSAFQTEIARLQVEKGDLASHAFKLQQNVSSYQDREVQCMNNLTSCQAREVQCMNNLTSSNAGLLLFESQSAQCSVDLRVSQSENEHCWNWTGAVLAKYGIRGFTPINNESLDTTWGEVVGSAVWDLFIPTE